MPIYEYVCRGCGKKIEEVILNSQEPMWCPTCNGELQKVPSTFNHKVIWKGVDPKHFYDSDGNWLPDRDPMHGM